MRLLSTLLLPCFASCGVISSFNQIPLLSSNDPSLEGLIPIDTELLQSLVSENDLRTHAETLFNLSLMSVPEFDHPTRVIGSAGHYATINHILHTLNKYHWYFDISVQVFNTVMSKINSVKIVVDGQEIEKSSGLSLTPPTKGGPVVGALVAVKGDGCKAEDYLQVKKGDIALIQRGVCPFGNKSILAGQHGAQAAIIYDNEVSKDILHGTLGEPTGEEVPTVAITKKVGDGFVEKLARNVSLNASVFVDSYVKNITTKNVIAETKLGDKENVVMIGAHTDSVEEGPGINDDGTGTISLLVLAKYLTKFAPTNAIRLGFWAAEEEGLIGSNYYAANLSPEENHKLRLFLDYDMMASPNYAFQVYDGDNIASPPGSQEIKDLYIDWYESHGLNWTLIPFDGRSDYVGFIDHGIPGGGIATGAEGIKTKEEEELFGGEADQWYDPCYHSLCDNLNNVDYFAWVVNTKLIAHSVAVYGNSLKGFPERTNSTVGVSSAAEGFKYRGNHLIF